MRGKRQSSRIINAIFAVPDSVRSMSLENLEVSVRTRNCLEARGLQRVEELFHFADEDLLRIPNFGSKCLRDLEEALLEASAKYEEAPIARESAALIDSPANAVESEYAKPTLLPSLSERPLAEVLDTWLASLDQRSGCIIRSRLGLDEESSTLEEVGTTFSLTRERVRQIQKRALANLRRVDGMGDKLDRIFLDLLHDRRSPLFLAGAPAEHVWLSNLRWPEQMLRFLLDHTSQNLSIFNLYGRPIVCRITEDDWTDRIRMAKSFLKESVPNQITMDEARRAIDAIAGMDALDLGEELWRKATEQAHFSFGIGGADGQLVAYGLAVEDLVRSVLESSDTPLHYRQIGEIVEERFGREDTRRAHQAAASVGLLLGRGIYGMRRHIPLNQQEEAYVRALCEEVVREGPPGRQWHAREILADIEEADSLVERLDRYSLSALLHRSRDLVYVGRFVWLARQEVATHGSVRLNLNNAVEALLEEEGAPLSRAEIVRRLSAIRGLGLTFQIHPKGRLFRAGPNVWGLLDRDFPADSDCLDAWLDRLESHLRANLKGAHVSEIASLLRVDESFGWPIIGAAQLDERFRVSSGDFLCLAGWTGTNRITMHEAMQFVTPMLIRGSSLELLLAEVERHLQRHISYDTLKAALRGVGARYDVQQKIWLCDAEFDEDSDDEDAPNLTLPC